MEEIIKQIAQIDLVAVSNRENSEQTLKEKRTQYEKEMQSYREERISKANKQAEAIYNEIVQMGEKGQQLESEKCKRSALRAHDQYLKIEEMLLNEVFNDLFGVEG